MRKLFLKVYAFFRTFRNIQAPGVRVWGFPETRGPGDEILGVAIWMAISGHLRGGGFQKNYYNPLAKASGLYGCSLESTEKLPCRGSHDVAA